jgi:hypothetical protein
MMNLGMLGCRTRDAACRWHCLLFSYVTNNSAACARVSCPQHTWYGVTTCTHTCGPKFGPWQSMSHSALYLPTASPTPALLRVHVIFDQYFQGAAQRNGLGKTHAREQMAGPVQSRVAVCFQAGCEATLCITGLWPPVFVLDSRQVGAQQLALSRNFGKTLQPLSTALAVPPDCCSCCAFGVCQPCVLQHDTCIHTPWDDHKRLLSLPSLLQTATLRYLLSHCRLHQARRPTMPIY